MSNPEPMMISSRCISSTLLRLVTGFFLVMTASAFHRISSHRNLQLRHPGESSHHKKAVSDFSGGTIFPILSQAPASTEVKNQNPISLKDLMQSTRPATGNNIVIIAGFEAFNVQLYRKAAALVTKQCPSVPVYVFSDADIAERPEEVERILKDCKVLFCSLIVDFIQVQWIKQRISNIPIRFVFESALELMSETKVGGFEMKGTEGGMSGPPAPVKAILKQFSSGREEDKMSGYLNFLKVGPKLLKWLPGKKASDLKTWLTVYSYWSEGALENVQSMLYLIIQEFKLDIPKNNVLTSSPALGTSSQVLDGIQESKVRVLVEYPQQGLYHPDLGSRTMEFLESSEEFASSEYMLSPKKYAAWYEATHPWVTADTPRIGILLYRKHVVTGQGYIADMIRILEADGVMPIPVFISGVEGHTVVRDLFTTKHEQAMRAKGILGGGKGKDTGWQLSAECTVVDAIVNTIGFPLVGGPAGSMKGGRQIEASKEILGAKNVPYIVAAPLLIQDTDSWLESGVQGLQSVVLYSLPELDGAIETMVLGGLVDGDKISVVPERVQRLTARLKAWVKLRKTLPRNRKIAILMYGFPPNVGAVGTAALLNVGNSLGNILKELRAQGYSVGDLGRGPAEGDMLISALKVLLQDSVFAGGRSLEDKIAAAQVLVDRVMQKANGVTDAGSVRVRLQEISHTQLKSWLGNSASVKMEKQWGDLESFSGIGTAGTPGSFCVVGLQIGEVFVGLQPLLGVEGDPMRLLFERDLTPHPQYASFYKWLSLSHKPDCLIHFGMHGTVEWLPGSPLGSTKDSWPDILLGNIPNIYIYACNNPSESALAKRRGYATIVSHNVPPYGRAGLYKELSVMKDLLADLRTTFYSPSSSIDLTPLKSVIPLIADAAEKSGIYDDLPYPFLSIEEKKIDKEIKKEGSGEGEVKAGWLTAHTSEALLNGHTAQQFVTDFMTYSTSLQEYLLLLEQRLFSEGLYEIGGQINPTQLLGYLDAVFGESDLSKEALSSIATGVSSGDASTAVLLRAENIQKHRHKAHKATERMHSNTKLSDKEKDMTGSDDAMEQYWAMKYRTRSGVDWSTLLTDEDKFAFRILENEGMFDFLNFQYLRLRRDWRDEDAEEQINQIISIASKSLKKGDKLQEGEESDIFKAEKLARLLWHNSKSELQSLIRGVGGEFVLPAPGGDVIRDGAGVLPTGRNIHALDPYRIPSVAAMQRGRTAARLIIEAHRKKGRITSGINGAGSVPVGSLFDTQEDTQKDTQAQASAHTDSESDTSTLGPYPGTVAVTLWGLDTIKTKGESVAILLALVGAEPVRESTGRVVGFELIPLSELGRPRIDVLGSMSGIFRDSFANVLDLLDDMFERASLADEPSSMNFIKLHTDELRLKGVDRPYSRLFSNPPGDFGSMVNEQIGSGDWSDGKELGSTWEGRNSFSYGRSSSSVGKQSTSQGNTGTSSASSSSLPFSSSSSASSKTSVMEQRQSQSGGDSEGGRFRPEVLSALLATTDRIVQEIDSVEYGLTDIQEYYANTGALKKAAENNRGGRRVGVSVIESFEKEVKPRELEETLRLEYRSKFLNPKWAEAMSNQGSGGAFEISSRMTALIGWAATTDFAEKWVFDGAADRYVLDADMADKLRRNNPEAFRNIVKRMLEARGRGYWSPSDDVVSKLQDLFEEVEDQIEGV